MLYIDFDGVILNTEPLLFEEWNKLPNKHLLNEDDKIKYVHDANWYTIIKNAEIINDSIYYLNNMDPTKTFILTKIHSQDEGVEKVLWLRKNGVKQSVILVPYKVRKIDMVDALGNTLVDDSLRNLKEWKREGGYPIFFDLDDDDFDSWLQYNEEGFKKTLSLSNIKFD